MDDSFVPSQGTCRFFETGSTAGIQAVACETLAMLLASLHTASTLDDLQWRSFCLHPLKGSERGRWSVWVNGNWRVTFEFHDADAYVLDYEDYH